MAEVQQTEAEQVLNAADVIATGVLTLLGCSTPAAIVALVPSLETIVKGLIKYFGPDHPTTAKLKESFDTFLKKSDVPTQG